MNDITFNLKFKVIDEAYRYQCIKSSNPKTSVMVEENSITNLMKLMNDIIILNL
jgi:hypothetical protein